jgi:hypothetical protein
LALHWTDETERLVVPELKEHAVQLAIMRAAKREHVSVYRPKGPWNLFLMAPLRMPDALVLELARCYLTPAEARVVERELGEAKHWP